jgi:[NiFe] hydrogenase assembly HybE family chaperone
MNLVWRLDEGQQGAGDWLHLPVGTTGRLQLGSQLLSFLGNHDPELGHYAACSLISPMFQFADHAAAVATAEAVIETLSDEHVARHTPSSTAMSEAPVEAPAQPARRGFLLGRRPASGDHA